MPKERKAKTAKRHEPLATQITKAEEQEQFVQPRAKPRAKAQRHSRKQQEEDFVSDSLSKKALAMAKEQQLEEALETRRERMSAVVRQKKHDSSDEEDFDEDEGDYDVEDVVLDPEEEKALALWSAPAQPRRTLADMIMEKIKEKEMEMAREGDEGPVLQRLNPKIVEVYRGVGRLLAKYKSGKLPKAFKMVPTLTNWEEILYLTEPDSWSPAAVAAATKIFASNLNAKMAQRFYALILLPHVRNDIDLNKKLNYHLYMALKKSVFKPAAFYKGVVLPLCESRTCTLREATIVGSIIVKVSIPALQSAVALLKIAQMEYSGANSIFIRILLDKKYSLPYRVIDALVEHFMGFIKEERQLPVLWHQALLVFVQRYKEDLTPNQKAQVKQLVKHQNHHAITPEIIRELNESKSRGEGQPPSANRMDM